MNLIKDSSFWWLQLNSTNSMSHSKPNRLFRNPMKLRAFFQSDNPTDLRHNETPLAPPKLCLAGDDLAMTPEELGSHGAKRSKRKPWREENDGNIDISHDFLELLGWVASSTCITAASLQPVLHSIYCFKSIFYWSSTGFDCHAWNCQSRDSPCKGGANVASQIFKGQTTKAYCFTIVDGCRWHREMLCKHAILKSATCGAWKQNLCLISQNWGVHRAADAIGYAISMRWLLIPSKENNWVFVRWVGGFCLVWCQHSGQNHSHGNNQPSEYLPNQIQGTKMLEFIVFPGGLETRPRLNPNGAIPWIRVPWASGNNCYKKTKTR